MSTRHPEAFEARDSFESVTLPGAGEAGRRGPGWGVSVGGELVSYYEFAVSWLCTTFRLQVGGCQYAFFVWLRCSAMATLVGGARGDASGFPPPASRCLQCRGSARPPELVQLRGCTDTFPFCQTLQRAIWIPLLYKKGLEAPLSDLPAVVSAIQTQVGFGGGSVQPVGALLAF